MLSLIEVLRLIIVTLAVGYIFSGFTKQFGFHQDFKISILAASPAIILHELAHKFVALFFGLNATLFASYFGLGIGVLLKAVSSPIIAFIPAYVSISGATPFQSAITAFAGPLTNLLLWFISGLLLKKETNKDKMIIYALSKRINIFLFFLNMIPIPPFDGSKVLFGLLSSF